jgi:hypothetical protein
MFRPMREGIMITNAEESGRKLYNLFNSAKPQFAWRDWGNHVKTSVKIKLVYYNPS